MASADASETPKRPAPRQPRPVTKTAPISFRVPLDVAARLDEKAAAAGLTRTAFLVAAVIEERTTIVARPKPSSDKRRALFLLSSLANNVNQIARRVNADAMVGRVSPHTYERALAELIELRERAQALADDVS